MIRQFRDTIIALADRRSIDAGRFPLDPLPKAIQVDNGSEFNSRKLDQWAYQNKVALDSIEPGKLRNHHHNPQAAIYTTIIKVLL